MIRIKICGITNYEDAKLASDLGADAVGFIFADSPRRIEPKDALKISRELPPFIMRVGVFVNANEFVIEKIADELKLDVIQLSGEESPDFCTRFEPKVIKTFHVKDESSFESMEDYEVDGYLLDTFVPGTSGGTGQTFNWDLAVKAKAHGPVILSGGLTPENVVEAILKVRPYAVDVSSGIEKYPGKKDPDKLKAFIDSVKRCRDIL